MRALLKKAEIIDAQEDGRYGKGKRGSDCRRTCSAGKAGWRRSARPRLSWKQKLLQPRPAGARSRLMLPLGRPSKATTTAKKSSAAGRTRSSNAPIPHEHWHCRSSRRLESIRERWVWGKLNRWPCPLGDYRATPRASRAPKPSAISLIQTAM